MAAAEPMLLQLGKEERAWLEHVLTVVVNGMERDGYQQKQPENFKIAICLLLKVQNLHPAHTVSPETVVL